MRGWSLAGQQPFALQTLALQLAVPTNSFSTFPCPLFRWFFVMTPQFHLAKDAFPLHLFFQRFQRLIDIVVANDDLQAGLLIQSGAGSYQNGTRVSTTPRHETPQKREGYEGRINAQ
jgi:hypothetical protein